MALICLCKSAVVRCWLLLRLAPTAPLGLVMSPRRARTRGTRQLRAIPRSGARRRSTDNSAPCPVSCLASCRGYSVQSCSAKQILVD